MRWHPPLLRFALTIYSRSRHDFTCTYMVCDGAGENRAFQSICATQVTPEHRAHLLRHSAPRGAMPDPSGLLVMPHPCRPDLPIFLLSDPPHLLKKGRNAWYSSGAWQRTGAGSQHADADLPYCIKWEHLQRAWQWDVNNSPRRAPHITEAHIVLDRNTVQQCHLATDCFKAQAAEINQDRRRRRRRGRRNPAVHRDIRHHPRAHLRTPEAVRQRLRGRRG